MISAASGSEVCADKVKAAITSAPLSCKNFDESRSVFPWSCTMTRLPWNSLSSSFEISHAPFHLHQIRLSWIPRFLSAAKVLYPLEAICAFDRMFINSSPRWSSSALSINVSYLMPVVKITQSGTLFHKGFCLALTPLWLKIRFLEEANNGLSPLLFDKCYAFLLFFSFHKWQSFFQLSLYSILSLFFYHILICIKYRFIWKDDASIY